MKRADIERNQENFQEASKEIFGGNFGGLYVLLNVVFALRVYFDSGQVGKKRRFPKENN